MAASIEGASIARRRSFTARATSTSGRPRGLFECVKVVPETGFQALSQVRRGWIAKGVVAGKREADELVLVDIEVWTEGSDGQRTTHGTAEAVLTT